MFPHLVKRCDYYFINYLVRFSRDIVCRLIPRETEEKIIVQMKITPST